MSLRDVHPSYQTESSSWVLCRDVYSRKVKEKGTVYLKPTPAQVIDGMGPGDYGNECYKGYLSRANLPEHFSDAVETFLGLLHLKDPSVELPPELEYLKDSATPFGESIMDLWRRINEQQLVPGRLGLLLDMPKEQQEGPPEFYISLYHAENVTNWDEGDEHLGSGSLNLVVINESSYERVGGGFNWEWKDRYRVLQLGEVLENEDVATYKQGLFESDNYNENAMLSVTALGSEIEELPFVFINSKDILAQPDNPPLLGLAELVVSLYRQDADYRHNLFMQGQETFVTIGEFLDDDLPDEMGEEKEVRVGAGAHIKLATGGDAKYVGVSAQGLSEQRSAIENDTKKADAMAGKLIQQSGGQAESGDALRLRNGSQTATLTQVAKASAAGLQKLLRIGARWIGANEEKVIVTPNLEFAKLDLQPRDFLELMQARKLGAPITKKMIYQIMVKRGLTKEEFEDVMREYEEEMENEGQSELQSVIDLMNQNGNQQSPANEPPTNNEGREE